MIRKRNKPAMFQKINTTFLGTLFFAGLFLLAACSKGDKNDQKLNAALMVIQAVPDAPPLTFYLNDNQQENMLVYPQNTGYHNITPGNTSLRLVYQDSLVDTIQHIDSLTGDTTFDTIHIDTLRTILDASVSLQPNKAYSVFVYDTVGAANAMTLQDDFSQAEDDKAHIRFLQLSPGYTSLDVSVGGQPLFTGRSFADNAGDPSKASFSALDPGTATITVQETGSDSVLFTLQDAEVKANAFYTLVAEGLPADTGTSAFQLQLIENYETPE